MKGTCSSCQLDTTLLLQLAGLCDDSLIGCASKIWEYDSLLLLIDRQFHLRNTETAVGLDGWRDTFVRLKSNPPSFKCNSPFPRYDKIRELWLVRHVTKPDFLATSTAPRSSHLLGSHPWTIRNDSRKCMGSTLVFCNICAEHDPTSTGNPLRIHF